LLGPIINGCGQAFSGLSGKGAGCGFRPVHPEDVLQLSLFFPEKVRVDLARPFGGPIHPVHAAFFRLLALLTGPGLLLVGVSVRILGKLRVGRETHAREAVNEVGELVDQDIVPERLAAEWTERNDVFIRPILLRSLPHLLHTRRADAVAPRASADRIEHGEQADRTLDFLVQLDEVFHGDFIRSAPSTHILEMTCAGD
jgi:hypothetical protein